MLSKTAALEALQRAAGGLVESAVRISPLKVQASPARKRSASSRTLADDDMSDEDDEKPLASVGFVGGAPAAPTVASQVKDCRAKIKELVAEKEQRLRDEDYMGAHHVHQMVQEQEQKLRSLQQKLDAMPTLVREAPPRVRGVDVVSTAVREQPAVAASPTVGCTSVAMAADDESELSEAVPEPQEVGECKAEAMEDDEEGSGQWCSRASDPNHVELPLEQGANELPFKLDKNTFESIYPYQRVGVAWMARLSQAGNGGILADEMGLGKTVQVCAFLSGARKQGATHALLLLPPTLLDQWCKEARRWCPGWPVYVYHGLPNQRAAALRRVSRPQGGILLASYGVLSSAGSDSLNEVLIDDAPSPVRRRRRPAGTAKRRRLDDDDGLAEGDESGEEEALCEVEQPPCELAPSGTSKAWDVVVCDEAHRMKGISTLLGKSVRKLNAKCRLLLTGTPVQNALQDLWALLDFAQPGLLGNHATFVKTFSDPIDKGSVRGATPFQVQLKKHLAEQLRTLIGPHILRRTKCAAGLVKACEGEIGGSESQADESSEADAEAGQLPPKRETLLWLAPSEEQMTAYKKILEKSEVIQAACSKQKLGVEVFRAIGLLKRLCNHPQLLLPQDNKAWNEKLNECVASAEAILAKETEPDATTATHAAEAAETEAVESDVPEFDAAAEDAEDQASAGGSVETMLSSLPTSLQAITEQSSKLRCLASLLPSLAARGHRTLVFSQSVKMLDLIWVTCLKPKGLRCLRMDGHTDVQARGEKVAKFMQKDGRFPFMLMTTHVGGVGLTLTAADRVVLVDPAWNPASDAQAVDRAYRIGQDKKVKVYRLIMSGLIEDKMFRLQVFKMGLTKTALEADQQHNYFTGKEIRALFDWTDPSEGETRKLLQEEHGAGSDEVVEAAANEDGADEGWRQAGNVVGMSDFAQLYSAVSKTEEPDDVCAAQLMEAQQKLGAADEKMTRMTQNRAAAECRVEELAKNLEEAIATHELLKERRGKLDEMLKQRRGELAQARKAETAAQVRLDKASRARNDANEAHLQAQLSHRSAADDKSAEQTSASALGVARSSEEVFARAIADVDKQLALVDDSGSAVASSIVDASAESVRKAARARDKLRSVMEALTARQGEMDAADEEVLKADNDVAEAEEDVIKAKAAEEMDGAGMQAAVARKSMELAAKSREKDRQRTELAQSRLQQRMETAREAVAQAVLAYIDAGNEFADSFQAAEAKGRSVKVPQVKAAQVATRSTLRALKKSSDAARKALEAASKTFAARRKAMQKVRAAAAEVMEAELEAKQAELAQTQAMAERDLKSEDRAACDTQLATAEAERSQGERDEAAAKAAREELKTTTLPQAKEAIKAAKLAEKEALNDRQQLHAKCSKVEKAASFVEEAKNSAISSLQAEAYDAKQVDKAYTQAKKARTES